MKRTDVIATAIPFPNRNTHGYNHPPDEARSDFRPFFVGQALEKAAVRLGNRG